METAQHYLEKARQCRRLVQSTDDGRTVRGLTAMAEEFDAKAKIAEASTSAADLSGAGSPNCPSSDDSADLA